MRVTFPLTKAELAHSVTLDKSAKKKDTIYSQ